MLREVCYVLQPSISRALGNEGSGGFVHGVQKAGERSSRYQSGGEVTSSSLGNVGTFWYPT